jgi:rhodanese-related sulfurtransferase
MMKHLLILVFFIIFLAPLRSQEPDSSKYQVLDCKEFISRYKESDKALLIDVREYADYRKSRIRGAVNMPRSVGYEAAADSLDKESALFIYCYAGVSSRRAAAFFYDKGFRKIYSLKGGMMRWRGEGMGVDRKRGA